MAKQPSLIRHAVLSIMKKRGLKAADIVKLGVRSKNRTYAWLAGKQDMQASGAAELLDKLDIVLLDTRDGDIYRTLIFINKRKRRHGVITPSTADSPRKGRLKRRLDRIQREFFHYLDSEYPSKKCSSTRRTKKPPPPTFV